MANKQFVLAYATKTPMSAEELEARIDQVTKHVRPLMRGEVSWTAVGDTQTGFIVWTTDARTCTWPSAVHGENEGAAWIHVPSAAGSPSSGVDPMSLARRAVTGELPRVELGAPCAVVHWHKGELRIVNDVLGMCRLFSFNMPDFGRVWSTRYGMAHIFSGTLPTVNNQTWEGMATLGWTASGRTHMGEGTQMMPFTDVRATPHGGVTEYQNLHTWMRSILDGDEPSIEDAALDMSRSLERADWWPQRPVADLSGGKDSRVTAAAAILAGTTDAVRTIDTDSGEVSTASQLVALLDLPIHHQVLPVTKPTSKGNELLERYLSLHEAWEGAYLARTAYRTGAFRGFSYAPSPSINGLGGEAMQGKTLLGGKWDELLRDADSETGMKRLEHMIRVGAGSSTTAGDAVLAEGRNFHAAAKSAGFTSAYAFMDYFYNFSKMPFWSIPLANENSLLPYYSPRMIERAIWSMEHPWEYGEMHKELLRSLIPSWADVPFYKPSAKTRSTTWMWQNSDWPEAKSIILEATKSLDTFSTEKIHTFLQEVEGGTGAVKHETAFSRIIWEWTFRMHVESLSRDVADSAACIRAVVNSSN